MKTVVRSGVAVATLAVAAFSFVHSAHANDNVLCVQEQLQARGFDPGPLDGQMGGRTRSAAQVLADEIGLDLPALDTANAGGWCRALLIPDGTYVATFGFADCGVLNLDGPNMTYIFGVCSEGEVTDPRYTATRVRFERANGGPVFRVDDATYAVEDIQSDPLRLRGQWTLGPNSFQLYFEGS